MFLTHSVVMLNIWSSIPWDTLSAFQIQSLERWFSAAQFGHFREEARPHEKCRAGSEGRQFVARSDMRL